MNWLASATACAACLLGLPGLRAQEYVVAHHDGERQLCTVRAQAYLGADAVGGYGFLLVEAQNLDARSHRLEVQLGSYDRGEADLRTGRTIVLGPHEHGRFFLPVPTPHEVRRLDVTVDGTNQTLTVMGSKASGLCGLLVTDRADAAPSGIEVLQALPSSFKDPAQQALCLSENLPADWRLFTGFHAVVVDGRAQLRDDVQEALRRFVFSGGIVVVAVPERLPAGPLRDLGAKADGDGYVAHGLGTCIAIPAFGSDSAAMRARVARLPKAGAAGWPAVEPMLRVQAIPGLGRAPVIGFLLVMLAFAVLVGPINFFLLRRWRLPMLALLTVPALGIGTTVVMLGYGLLHDGFGVRGVVRSWTWLDQSRHEGVTLGARTLFAGLAPGSLSMSPDAMLVAPRALRRRDRRAADRWHFDAESGLLDGGVLPSRTTTALFSANQGVVRERLRARFVGDGELHLLSDGGVAPAGEVLVRDFDGVYWNGEAPVLRRVGDGDAAVVLRRMRSAVGRCAVDNGRGGSQVLHLDALVDRLLGADELPAGAYVASVATAPWLDEHGMAVDYDMALHFVVGRFAAEDLVR